MTVEDVTYHTIIQHGWLGDPRLAFLYECSAGHFDFQLIYETPEYNPYSEDRMQLVFDDSESVLRLEYHMSERASQYYDIPPILYEHPVP